MRRSLFAVLLAACVDTGQEPVSFAMRVAGTAPAAPAPALNGWEITLDSARLAFGPLYLCPGFQAGSLCDTARAEWVDSAVVDVLDPATYDAGTVEGSTGPVRSWMFDYGVVSLLTQQQPVALAAAQRLDGNSLRLSGSARKGGRELPFALDVRIQQVVEGGASIVRKSDTDTFSHDLAVGDTALTVRFDARPWLRDVDFDALVEMGTCASVARPKVCAGDLELSCSDTGVELSQRSCTAERLVCLRGLGCTDRVRFQAGSQGDQAVRNALTGGTRPAFEWTTQGDVP
ncbi:MAG: hypothetical protein JNK82_34495 [Myxococcaceae bacterium]|nr:hypothetical protein [Myxococcaceae bacterium]